MFPMKFFALLVFLVLSIQSFAQDKQLKTEPIYLSQFGLNSNLVSFIPLFKLSENQINNKAQEAPIKQLPPGLKLENTAYGFIYFNGLSQPTFPQEICFLIENPHESQSTIYLDRNGNMDFSDDGKGISLSNSISIELTNEKHKTAALHYSIARSQISPNYKAQLKARYQSKYPQSEILAPRFWLTANRLNLALSQNILNGKIISILLLDNSADGLFSLETHSQGDRILITEGIQDGNQDFSSILRQAQVLDPNAIFKLYDQNYYLKSFSPDGRHITLAETNTKPDPVFVEGEDISDFTIQLLDGSKVRLDAFLSQGNPLLIDVGGHLVRSLPQARARHQKNIRNK